MSTASRTWRALICRSIPSLSIESLKGRKVFLRRFEPLLPFSGSAACKAPARFPRWSSWRMPIRARRRSRSTTFRSDGGPSIPRPMLEGSSPTSARGRIGRSSRRGVATRVHRRPAAWPLRAASGRGNVPTVTGRVLHQRHTGRQLMQPAHRMRRRDVNVRQPARGKCVGRADPTTGATVLSLTLIHRGHFT